MQMHWLGVLSLRVPRCDRERENRREALRVAPAVRLRRPLGGMRRSVYPQWWRGLFCQRHSRERHAAGLTNQQFIATANDGSRPTLNWSVNGIAGGNSTIGTISATGLYTAPEFPPAPNAITVSATDTVDTSKTGSSAVTLNNPIPQLSSVSP